jgi:PBP1b-binding outer membrane lipoprotein LpoB
MKRIALTCALTLLIFGCQDTQKQRPAEEVDTLSAEPAAADTMPEGFKSIHQLQLEAHPDTASDSSAARPPGQ